MLYFHSICPTAVIVVLDGRIYRGYENACQEVPNFGLNKKLNSIVLAMDPSQDISGIFSFIVYSCCISAHKQKGLKSLSIAL